MINERTPVITPELIRMAKHPTPENSRAVYLAGKHQRDAMLVEQWRAREARRREADDWAGLAHLVGCDDAKVDER